MARQIAVPKPNFRYGFIEDFSASAAFRIASSNTSEISSWGSTGSNTSKIYARQVGSGR